MSASAIQNIAHLGEEGLREYLTSLDDANLMVQEFVQKGAMHAIQFLLTTPGDIKENALLMQDSLLEWKAADLFDRLFK